MNCDHHTLTDFVFAHWGWSLFVFAILAMEAGSVLGKFADALGRRNAK